MDSKSRVFPSETRRHETQTQDLVPVFVVGRLLCSTHFTHSPCAVRALLGFALLQGVLRGDPGMSAVREERAHQHRQWNHQKWSSSCCSSIYFSQTPDTGLAVSGVSAESTSLPHAQCHKLTVQ